MPYRKRGDASELKPQLQGSRLIPHNPKSYSLEGSVNEMSSSIKTSGNYNEWPEEGYIPEDAYPLEVIHLDDTGYVLLQIDAMDADTLIVACQIDFDYESEGAVARKDIAGLELAPYRKLNLAAFFERQAVEPAKATEGGA